MALELQPVEGRVRSLEEELQRTQDELAVARKQLAKSQGQLQTAEKQLAKSQRQLQTAETYNEDLREQVDKLNQELHRYKRSQVGQVTQVGQVSQVEDKACQTEDILAPWAVEATQEVPTSQGSTEASTNEASINEVDTTGMSLADSLRATAEAALSQTGTVYDETSGLYYDYTTGMYYDPNNHLHYDPNTGVYYYYDQQTQTYQFHSQVELPASHGADVAEQGEEDGQNKKKKKKNKEKRKRKERHKDDSEEGDMEVIMVDEDKEVRKKHREKKRHKKKKHKSEEEEKAHGEEVAEEEVSVADLTVRSGTEERTEQEKFIPSPDGSSQPVEDGVDDDDVEDGMECEMGAGLEEGEVVDSEGEDHMHQEEQSEESSSSGESEESDDSTLQWPPCIRAMVQESDTLRPGSLFIITCDGGTIGREKDMGHAIRIPDLNISKTHVEISYDREEGQYTVTDLGSQNGTMLNGLRISEPKCRSAPCPLAHQAVLQLGGTVLSLHIHSGTETCDLCEPGQVMAAIAAREKLQQAGDVPEAAPVLSKEDKERQRRRELKQIKKKYQLESAPFVVSKELQPPGYKDRAGERRDTVGSDNPYQKDDAPASVHQAIGTSNKGRRMLEKMGWKEGKGLGKTSQGRQEPVQVSLRESHAGLGASAPRDVESFQLKTGKNWRKARERFYAIEQKKQTPHPSRTVKQEGSWVRGETVVARGEGEPSGDDSADVKRGTPSGDDSAVKRGIQDGRKNGTQQGPVDKGVNIFED
ncbi:angiogenic factor with G patch and FHA domains 1-like isoform X7 [Branchiostoma floridae x Branchiostoma japonicum]